MEAFRYSLDKSSKKFVCPNCSKKTFVLYIDTETGNYLTTDFGKCDREQNCNYHKAPPKGKKAYLIEFLCLKSISDKAYKLTDLNGIISIIPKSQILEQSIKDCWIIQWYLKTSTIQYLTNESKYFNTDEVNFINEVVTSSWLSVRALRKKPSYHSWDLQETIVNAYNKNPTNENLTAFLLNKFTFDEVQKAMKNYFVTGTNICWTNSTVFWQINEMKQIQGAKIMLYDRFKGKRIKEPYNHINWLHKATKEPDFNLCQCLFGLHRINEDYQKTIAVCESEKTAIVMSMFLPEYIWLATGSKGNFKFELLKPVKKRNIIAFPDKGEYNNWLNKATELNAIGFKIAVSEILEQTDFENGFDLADYYFEINK